MSNAAAQSCHRAVSIFVQGALSLTHSRARISGKKRGLITVTRYSIRHSRHSRVNSHTPNRRDARDKWRPSGDSKPNRSEPWRESTRNDRANAHRRDDRVPARASKLLHIALLCDGQPDHTSIYRIRAIGHARDPFSTTRPSQRTEHEHRPDHTVRDGRDRSAQGPTFLRNFRDNAFALLPDKAPRRRGRNSEFVRTRRATVRTGAN